MTDFSEFDEFVSCLATVIGESRVPEEVKKNLVEQQVTTKERFLLLDNGDLKELGFLMGPRKQLVHWIQAERGCEDLSVSAICTTPQPSTDPVNGTVTPRKRMERPPVVEGSTDRRRPAIRGRKFKNFPVGEILSGKRTKRFDGSALVQKLRGGVLYDKHERTFLTKTVCRYLMAHCEQTDAPTMQEKVDMAESIVTTFPVLKDPVTGGYAKWQQSRLVIGQCSTELPSDILCLAQGEFCDAKSHSGYINYYVRTVRSRSADIVTRWTHAAKKRTLDAENVEEDTDDVRTLRERRPNASNRTELLQLMDNTREERRQWIVDKSPSITDILQRYPRFQDIDTALRDEFAYIAADCKSLLAEFQPLKAKVLQVAGSNSAAATQLSLLKDDSDEDKKSEVAFMCLVSMLPTPVRRGAKGPKLSQDARIGYFFTDCQDKTVEEAVDHLRAAGCLQPCLFRTAQQQYFVKCDNIAIALPSASCFTEAVEFLFFTFWVFGVKYPQTLSLFYQFVERLVGVGCRSNSAVLRDLFRALDNAAVATDTDI